MLNIFPFLFFQRGLNPVIPAELVLSFYLQGWKLILAVYHIVVDPKTNMSKFNRYQAECVIPWVNDVLLLLTIALQSAQQLKDKVSSTLISGHVSKLGREQIKELKLPLFYLEIREIQQKRERENSKSLYK